MASESNELAGADRQHRQPPHALLSTVFQWIGFFLASLLLITVLLIGVGHFNVFVHNWTKEQRAVWTDKPLSCPP